MNSEVMKFIREICNLSDYDKCRLLECIHCPFNEECHETIENPVDNEDGSCKTKQHFMNKLKGSVTDD